MARATKQIAPPPPPADVVKSVTLVLSLEEARTLAVLVARVSGDQTNSPRRHATNVSNALDGIDITYKGAPEHALISDDKGRYQGFYFNDYGSR